jgi:hypothetical protein
LFIGSPGKNKGKNEDAVEEFKLYHSNNSPKKPSAERFDDSPPHKSLPGKLGKRVFQ